MEILEMFADPLEKLDSIYEHAETIFNKCNAVALGIYNESVIYESVDDEIAQIDKEIAELTDMLKVADEILGKATKEVPKDAQVNFDKQKFIALFTKCKNNIKKIAETVANTKHAKYAVNQMKDFSDRNAGGKATKVWNGFKTTAMVAVQPVVIPGSSSGMVAAVSVIEVGRNFFDLARNDGLHCLKEIRGQMAKSIHHERKIAEIDKKKEDDMSKVHPLLSLKKAWHVAWKSVHNCILQAEKIIRFVMVKKIKADKVNYVKMTRKYHDSQMNKMDYEDKKHEAERKNRRSNKYHADIKKSYNDEKRIKKNRKERRLASEEEYAKKKNDYLKNKVGVNIGYSHESVKCADLLEGIDFFDI